ncbi:LOW QUALITY PROTEIN: hypothetical protein HID58_092167, partial [Brassica napus]
TMELFSLSSILLLLVLSFTSPILSISDQPLLISSVVPDEEEESCPYTVIVTTSWDQITFALGDADGNKVVARRLDEPLTGGGGFEKCSSDTFQVKVSRHHLLSLHLSFRSRRLDPRDSRDLRGGSKSVKFDFNKNVPDNTWYGHNYCNKNWFATTFTGISSVFTHRPTATSTSFSSPQALYPTTATATACTPICCLWTWRCDSDYFSGCGVVGNSGDLD